MEYLWAFDLSMDNTGITIFELDTFAPVHIMSVKTNKKHSHGERLYHKANEIHKLRELYPAKVVVMERGFSRFNTSTQVIYRVHGLINYLFHDVEQVYYPPKTIKEAIVSGNASKKLVREKIEKVYTDVEFEDEDQSDSFAVGLTYGIKNGLVKWDKKLTNKKNKKD